MSVTATLYGGFLKSLGNKQINLNSDTFMVMLLSSSYTPSDTHQYQSDVSSYEITGTGYTAGGATIASTATSYASDVLTFTGGNVSWGSSSISAAYAVVYDSTPGAAASNPLVGYVNFGGTISDTSGTFEVTWNASGIATITHS
ncbi:hypothetical protein ACAG26_24410 [Mycobacterium sp. pUA109]|uniref:hypothetical protein n=1 Tax=Mycobacterium sp. pUA109 TaxID=3238982 RepID=UPI00351AD27A